MKLKIDRSWGIEEVESNNIFGYQFFPHQAKGEGFFIAAMRKNEEQEEIRIHTKNTFDHPSNKTKERLSDWVINSDDIEFVLHDELILGLPKKHLYEIVFLGKALKVIQKGTAIAVAKHDKLIPEHAFALSSKIATQNFSTIELTYDQAIAFLRKNVLNLPSQEKGFALMRYENTPIGWANLLGNRLNNLYPSASRIRS